MRRLVLVIALVCAPALLAWPAAAAPFPDAIELPGAGSAEGIAVGRGATFYAGELFTGAIYRGDLRSGGVELLRAATPGRMAVGLALDRSAHLLFVAGGGTGQGYVYDARTGEDVAVLQLSAPAGPTFLNDVTLTRDAAWFTDSVNPLLHRVPLLPGGRLGTPSTLEVQGPAAALSGDFNLNGIAATPDGSQLLVAHSGDAAIYRVDPVTGASTRVAGLDVPAVDGILLEGGRLWIVQNVLNQVLRVRLAPDLSSGVVEETITSPLFQVPTTVARHGSRLALVNAKFDTGIPPTAERFEVVLVDGR